MAVRRVSLEKGVFIDTALPSSPWALLGSSHGSPLLQTRTAASLSCRLSLQRLLNTAAITTWDSSQKSRTDVGLLLVPSNVTGAFRWV